MAGFGDLVVAQAHAAPRPCGTVRPRGCGSRACFLIRAANASRCPRFRPVGRRLYGDRRAGRRAPAYEPMRPPASGARRTPRPPQALWRLPISSARIAPTATGRRRDCHGRVTRSVGGGAGGGDPGRLPLPCRADRALSDPDRAAGRHPRRLHHGDPGDRPQTGRRGRGGGRRRPPRGPRTARAARRARPGEGPQPGGGRALHLRLRGLRRACAGDRRPCGDAAARGGHDPAGQDQHPRVRAALLHREQAGAARPYPLGPDAVGGRFERRGRGRGGGWARADRAGQRRRRLDPYPVLGVRAVRDQAEPGPGQRRSRARCDRSEHERPDRPHGRRRGRPPRRPVRAHAGQPVRRALAAHRGDLRVVRPPRAGAAAGRRAARAAGAGRRTAPRLPGGARLGGGAAARPRPPGGRAGTAVRPLDQGRVQRGVGGDGHDLAGRPAGRGEADAAEPLSAGGGRSGRRDGVRPGDPHLPRARPAARRHAADRVRRDPHPDARQAMRRRSGACATTPIRGPSSTRWPTSRRTRRCTTRPGSPR